MKHIILALIAIIVTLSLILILNLPYSNSNDSEDEMYSFLSTEYVPQNEVPLLMLKPEQIILFYDDEGVVNVYNLLGEFLYGFQIEALKNGVGDMAFDDVNLYVNSKGNTMYIFEGESLIRYFRRADDPDEYERIECTMEGEINNADGCSIYYYNDANNCVERYENGSIIETIISFPNEHGFLDDHSMVVILLAVAFIVHYAHAKRSRQ